jgi:hypothetical protein
VIGGRKDARRLVDLLLCECHVEGHEFQMDPSTERVRRHRQKGVSDPASNRTVSLYKERTGIESVNDIIARVAERSGK